MEFQIEQAKDCVTGIKTCVQQAQLHCAMAQNAEYRHCAENEEKLLIHMLKGRNIHTCSNSTLIHGCHTQSS